MECEKNLVSLYIDGMLSDDDVLRFEKHLEECASCENNLASLKQIVAELNSLPDRPVPDDFRVKIMNAVKEEVSHASEITATAKRRGIFSKIRPAYVYAAATAACLILGFLFINSIGRMPIKSANKAMTASEPASEAPQQAMSLASEMLAEDYAFDDEPVYEEGISLAAAENQKSDTDDSATGSVGVHAAGDQKIILTAYYDLAVTNFDKTVDEVRTTAAAAGGYIENFSSSIYSTYESASGPRDLKSGNICLKIPQEQYSTAKIKIEKMGKITYTQEGAENITSQYVDISARLDVKKAEEQRLLELIGKAQEIDDLISLETRLSYVRSDIEAMTSQLKNWDRSVKYSTINIGLTEIDNSQIKQVNPSLGDSIKEGFYYSINNFVYTAERLAVWLAQNSIAIIMLALATIIVLSFIKRKLFKRGDKNEEN